MEQKQGRPARMVPDMGAGHTPLDLPMEAWIREVGAREPRDSGKSGLLTTTIKQFTATSPLTLGEVVSMTGALAYIQPVLRFVLHVPSRKRPVARTRPITMAEEVAKLVVAVIIAQTAQYLNNRQWAQRRVRCAGDVARMPTMLLNDTREQGSSVVLYKRDRTNGYGTLDLAGVAHLLQKVGLDPPKARWY